MVEPRPDNREKVGGGGENSFQQSTGARISEKRTAEVGARLHSEEERGGLHPAGSETIK